MLLQCDSFEEQIPRDHYGLLKGLSAEEINRVSDNFKLRNLKRNQYICLQHSVKDRVFNLASGCAIVERISNDGRRQILAFVFPGDFFGLSSTEHYEYGIKCLVDLSVYEAKRNRLFELSEQMDSLKLNLKSLLAMIQQMTFDQVYLLGQLSAYERVAYMIIHLLKRIPNATQELIELPMTRADIADYLGLNVETVSRTLSRIKKDGIIATPDSTSIKILDLPALRALANIL